jgi:predicted deacylase
MYSTIIIAVVVILVIILLSRPGEKLVPERQSGVYYFSPDFLFDNDTGDFKTVPTIGFVAGVHGNEPAGTNALMSMIQNNSFQNAANAHKVNIIVVPAANPYGLQRDMRWTNNPLHPHLNRSFSSCRGDTVVASRLLQIFASATLVVDFHEGWGWHKINRASIGSTVSPSQTISGMSDAIAKKLTHVLNANIDSMSKQFTYLPDISCDIKSTLSCNMQRAGRDYILIETTGQKNVQPMPVRVAQVQKCVQTVLEEFSS